MRLALWDMLPADFLMAGLTAGTGPAGVRLERHTPERCLDLLLGRQVDAALLPTLVVLTHPDVFDVLPGAAFSTWKFPYARLVLRRGLEQVASVRYAAPYAQEALLTRIILREHYGLEPAFVPFESEDADAAADTASDAALVVGPDAPLLQSEHVVLNLGEEWFELVNYPMVWGLFAARRDEATPAMVETLLEAVEAAEQHRSVWVQAREMPPVLHAFYAEDLRLRFDDLATASLTELRQYLYFYNVTDEVPELPLYLLPDDDEHDGRAPLL